MATYSASTVKDVFTVATLPTPLPARFLLSGVVTWVDNRKRHIDFAIDGQRARMSGFSRQLVPEVGTRIVATIDSRYGIVLAWREP